METTDGALMFYSLISRAGAVGQDRMERLKKQSGLPCTIKSGKPDRVARTIDKVL